MQTQLIEYTHAGNTLEGFCAFDPKHGKQQPLVLVAHAWAGRDEFACDKARALADLGYVGFAIDMFGKGILGNSNEENAQLIAPFIEDRQLLLARLQAGLNAAQQLPVVDQKRIGAIGFCFGGLCVLDLARSGIAINGVVSFHGLLNAPENTYSSTISAKVLVLHGYDDPMATPDQVITFCQEMTTAKSDWQLHAYGNTVHAFTKHDANDPDFGTVYNALANQRAWAAMQYFFTELFTNQ